MGVLRPGGSGLVMMGQRSKAGNRNALPLPHGPCSEGASPLVGLAFCCPARNVALPITSVHSRRSWGRWWMC